MTYQLKYTQTFEKQIAKIKKKDKTLMEEAMKKVEKLREKPYMGKPLEYRLAPYRSVRVKRKYRLVYLVDEEEEEVALVAFGHRKEIYKLMLLQGE